MPTPEPATLPVALVEEAFEPHKVNLIGQQGGPGVAPTVTLRFLIGPVGPDSYISAKGARITADLAIQLGHAMIDEGRKAKAPGIVVPPTGVPADLHARAG